MSFKVTVFNSVAVQCSILPREVFSPWQLVVGTATILLLAAGRHCYNTGSLQALVKLFWNVDHAVPNDGAANVLLSIVLTSGPR